MALFIYLLGLASFFSWDAVGLELVIDAGMVGNIQNGTEHARRFSSTDYVDLTCKVPGRLPSLLDAAIVVTAPKDLKSIGKCRNSFLSYAHCR